MKASVFTCGVVAACLVVTPALDLNTEVTSSLSFDMEAAKKRPVSRVISLLKDMLKQLEKEGEEDEAAYDKMACWCETNDKEKTKSISDAQTRISDKNTKIEEHTANSARLNAEISDLNKEVAENQAALDKATSIRQKQLAEFNKEEKNLLQSISGVKSAITVLSKHKSLLQVPRSHVAGVAASVKHAMKEHASLLSGVLTHSERRKVTAFVQAFEDEDEFDAQPKTKSYAPQSGEIFGILKQMKETFENNLSSSQKEEMENQKSYEELKTAKEEEVKAGQGQLDTKTQELADTDEKNAQAKQDVEDTTKSLTADEAFLVTVKEKCTANDAEWAERQKTRQSETEAVSKALAILSADDAHDLFTKTFNPAALLQKESIMHSERRVRASELLSAVADKLQNPRLASIAIKLRLDAFTRVKKSIDGMVTELVKEKADEIKKKDFCVDELNKNEQESSKKEREKQDIVAKIADLEGSIAELTKAIDGMKADIAEDRKQLKNAAEDRDKETKDFQTTVADQRATQKLLTAALNVLNGFYAKKPKTALVERQAPAGFKAYGKNAGATGVTQMLQQIINDAKAMETEAVRSEKSAQKAYEAIRKKTNDAITDKGKDIVNKSENKAKKEDELVESRKEKDAANLTKEQLANSRANLKNDCDFIQDNFEIRQTARDEEIEALKQAKAILSGAKFEQFLQSA